MQRTKKGVGGKKERLSQQLRTVTVEFLYHTVMYFLYDAHKFFFLAFKWKTGKNKRNKRKKLRETV